MAVFHIYPPVSVALEVFFDNGDRSAIVNAVGLIFTAARVIP
jgi:hypothetical protein